MAVQSGTFYALSPPMPQFARIRPILLPFRQVLHYSRFIFGLALVAVNPANADWVLHPWTLHTPDAGAGRMTFEFNYFGSSSNFDSAGRSTPTTTPTTTPTQTSTLSGFEYARLQNDITVEYGIGNGFAIYGRLSGAWLETSSNSQPAGTVSKFGLTDQAVGLSYRIGWIYPQFQIDFPGYATTTDLPARMANLGDGSVDFTGGVGFNYPIPSLFAIELGGTIGFTYRTGYYSSALPWSVNLKFGDPFYAQVQVLGLMSFKTDPHASARALFRPNLGESGSLMTGAMNPSSVQFRGVVGHTSGVFLSVTHSIWGQMVPHGLTIAVGYQLGWGAESATSSSIMSTTASADNTEIEARVLRTQEKLGLVKINKGAEDGVQVGDHFHLFSTQTQTGKPSEPQAIARVTHSHANESALEILEYLNHSNVWIIEGDFAKRVNIIYNKEYEPKTPSLTEPR